MKKMMCPQCGAALFYVQDDATDSAGVRKLYFNVSFEGEVVPFKPEYMAVCEIVLSEINCSSCSWSGPLIKLRKKFFG